MSKQGKKRPRTVENVKAFWNKEAKEWGNDPRVTIRDHYLRLLNIETISGEIRGSDNLLDIGCGTGFSTLFYAQVVNNIVGADYAETMIQKARRFLRDKKYFSSIMKKYNFGKKITYKNNISFEEANIVNLTYKNKFFDCVVSERVLVNLPTRSDQSKAMKEIFRVLKKKGTWVVGEASLEGHKMIDQLRLKFNLNPLEKYWHNLYLEESTFEKEAKRIGFRLVKKIKYETYQFLTKIVHPLLVLPNEPKFICGFNNTARAISMRYPDYKSVNKIGLEVFLKKEFRPLLKRFDRTKISDFDKVIPRIVDVNPNFANCSHHVLYFFKKK